MRTGAVAQIIGVCGFDGIKLKFIQPVDAARICIQLFDKLSAIVKQLERSQLADRIFIRNIYGKLYVLKRPIGR